VVKVADSMVEEHVVWGWRRAEACRALDDTTGTDGRSTTSGLQETQERRS
jgi:hypothetical protein